MQLPRFASSRYRASSRRTTCAHSLSGRMIMTKDASRDNTAPARVGAASFPWLVADAGGTNVRFGWVTDSGSEVQHVHKLPVADYAEPALAVRAYLDRLSATLGSEFRRPRWAALAVATAVDRDIVELTNSRWRFSPAALRDELG